MTALTFTPSSGAGSTARRLTAQTRMELTLLLRNGEQLLLTIAIPTIVLLLFAKAPIVDVPGRRIDFVAPGVLGLALLSTAFTGQAIATGFERRYAVLRRLGATPLSRSTLLVAKTLAVLAVEAVQVALLVAVAYALGWHPHGNPATVVALLVLGTAAFSGLGLLMAGTLRAEATLAAANLVFLLLLALGGVVVPLHDFGSPLRDVLGLLPISALTDGLRHVLRDATSVPMHDWLTLAAWAVGSITVAARTFRWD